MEFWNSLLTEKSWAILQDLSKKPFHFIVIGGWAAYLWTKAHKSKDIDIIIPNFKDLEFLKQEYALKKNDALKKYEIQIGDIDIDIYVPYYSRLALPLEEIIKNTTRIENIPVVSPEVLLILKQAAELDRGHSVKGAKDRVDIITLVLNTGVNFQRYRELLGQHQLLQLLPHLKKTIKEFKDIHFLSLNPCQFKMKKNEVLDRIKF